MKTLLIFVFLDVLISSCNQLNNNNLFDDVDIKNITDTLPVLNVDNNEVLNMFQDKDVVMISFFNGNCSYCIAGIVKRARYVDSIFGKNIGLLFIANIANSEDTALLDYYLLDKLRFKYPVLYDVKNQFYKWNNKTLDQGITTFLVNKNGNILIQGDPMENKKIEKKYLKFFQHN